MAKDQKTIKIQEELTPAEAKAVFLMRNLKPYERIEIHLDPKNPRKISVISTAKVREDFPS